MPLPSRTQPPAERAAALVRLMEENAQGDYIGESISQLEHSLQCAHLAAKAGMSLDTFVTSPASLFSIPFHHELDQESDLRRKLE